MSPDTYVVRAPKSNTTSSSPSSPPSPLSPLRSYPLPPLSSIPPLTLPPPLSPLPAYAGASATPPPPYPGTPTSSPSYWPRRFRLFPSSQPFTPVLWTRHFSPIGSPWSDHGNENHDSDDIDEAEERRIINTFVHAFFFKVVLAFGALVTYFLRLPTFPRGDGADVRRTAAGVGILAAVLLLNAHVLVEAWAVFYRGERVRSAWGVRGLVMEARALLCVALAVGFVVWEDSRGYCTL